MCLVTVINFIGNQIITYIPIIYLYDSSGEVNYNSKKVKQPSVTNIRDSF